MAVRAWQDDDSELRVPVHAGIDPTGGLEVFAVVKAGAKTGFEAIARGVNSSGAGEWTLGMDNSNRPFFFINDGSLMILPTSVPTLGTSDWWEIAYSKSDLTAGTFHFHNLTSDAVTHTAGDVGGTVNFPGTIAGGFVAFGEAGGDDLNARIAVAGLRAAAASNAAWDTLFAARSSADVATHFAGGSAWNFNQTTSTDPIVDLTGEAATIAGTISGPSDLNGIAGTTIVFGEDPPSWDFVTAPPPLTVTFRFSGGAANANPAVSIGGAESSEGGVLAEGLVGVLLNVLPDFSRPAAIAGTTVYRCVYAHLEDNGFETPADLTAWLEDLDLAAGVTVAIGAAPEGPGGVAQTLAGETVAPTGVTFTVPTEGAPLALGEAASDEGVPIWFRVTVAPDNPGGLGNGGVLVVGETPL
jgi:hypothetical protein